MIQGDRRIEFYNDYNINRNDKWIKIQASKDIVTASKQRTDASNEDGIKVLLQNFSGAHPCNQNIGSIPQTHDFIASI